MSGHATRGRIHPLLLWHGVIAGPLAWALHLGTAWSVTELACVAPTSGGVLTHGGSLGGGARWAAWGGTVIPWLIAVSAVAACLLVTLRRRRLRALHDDSADPTDPDVLAAERVSLLLVLGWFLSLMSLAAITGGGIALAVLEPCA